MVSKPESSLEQLLPEGQIVNRAWLLARAFTRPRVDYALRAGKLAAVAHGIYRKPGPPLKWEHLVYSLNEMGCKVRVGGRSALELQGMAHYLPLGKEQRIDLFGIGVPEWVAEFQGAFRFVVHGGRLFDPLPEAAVRERPFGAWDWPIPFSTPELALLEFLSEVRDEGDFALADQFFESATALRPDLLNVLLKACTRVKTKRLFLWFSDRHADHPWHGLLEPVSLGSGKRVLIRGGAYDATHQITVPREMAGGSQNPLY